MCGKVAFPYSTAVSNKPFLSPSFSLTNPPGTFVCVEPLLMARGISRYSVNHKHSFIINGTIET